jgi:hypothetical protein
MESKNGEPRFEVRFSKKLANEIKSIILNSKRKAEIIAVEMDRPRVVIKRFVELGNN